MDDPTSPRFLYSRQYPPVQTLTMEDRTMTDIKTIRYLVEIQGYTCQSDEAIRAFAPWLKVTPAVYAMTVAQATWLGDWKPLAMLAPLAILGALLPSHPFDSFYQFIWAPRRNLAPIPETGAPRVFSYGVAAAWLVSTALAFGSGKPFLGTVLGLAFTAMAMVPVLTGFCLSSFIWARVLRLPVREDCRAAAAVEV